MGYFWDLAKDLPAGIEDHPFYRILDGHYHDYQGEERLAFVAVKTSEAVDHLDRLVSIGVEEDRARELALAAVMRDSDSTEDWEREDAEEEAASVVGEFLTAMAPAVQRMALQPGAQKVINGKTYILNEHHRWALPHESEAGSQKSKAHAASHLGQIDDPAANSDGMG